MKKTVFLYLNLLLLLMCSCSGSKQTLVAQTPQHNSPFGPTFQMPCEVYDTPDFFKATGIFMGSYRQKGKCQEAALENAKALVYAKYHHVYEGMVSNYDQTIGNNRGNDIATKLEKAGDQVIKAILNDVSATCIRWSEVQDDGMIECYVAIEVLKEEIADKVSQKVDDVLTEDEKLKIRFDEENYRKEMEKRMKAYKERQGGDGK